MLFIFSTPELIRHLQQLKTIVLLHWCLICAILQTLQTNCHTSLWRLSKCRSIDVFYLFSIDSSRFGIIRYFELKRLSEKQSSLNVVLAPGKYGFLNVNLVNLSFFVTDATERISQSVCLRHTLLFATKTVKY